MAFFERIHIRQYPDTLPFLVKEFLSRSLQEDPRNEQYEEILEMTIVGVLVSEPSRSCMVCCTVTDKVGRRKMHTEIKRSYVLPDDAWAQFEEDIEDHRLIKEIRERIKARSEMLKEAGGVSQLA